MDQREHYRTVKARLNAGPPPPPPPPPPPKPLLDLGPLMAEAHAMADKPAGPMWKHIIREVAVKHHLTVEELVGPRRYGYLITARLDAYHRLRAHGYSLKQIAYRMGNRDHTTVLAGLRSRSFNPMQQAGDL